MKNLLAISALLVVQISRTDAQNPGAQNCADLLDRSHDCLENLKNTEDAQTLLKRQDSILRKCLFDLPERCSTMRKAIDRCHDQVSKDNSIRSLKGEIKKNISKCFERFSSNNSPARQDFSSQWAPASPFPGNVRDPCAPSEDQMSCMKGEMRKDDQAREISKRLQDKQTECFSDSNSEQCRLDGKPQLQQCVEISKLPLIQQGTVKMQECMQAAMGGFLSPSF